MKRILFYPIMTNGKHADHYLGEYNPISKLLTKKSVPHWLVNKSVHGSMVKILKQYNPTDVVFRLSGLRVNDISYLRSRGIKSHTIQHGWPVKSSAHTPITTNYHYVWSQACVDFYDKYTSPQTCVAITGSPRYDDFFLLNGKKTFNKRPVIGFNSIPYYIWKHRDDIKQAMEYAKTIYSLNRMAFPEIIQRIHPHEHTNGWLKKYKRLPGSDRIIFEDPYSRPLVDFFNDIDILVTTQSGTIIEAAMLGIPCVSMLFFNKQQYVTSDQHPISTHITRPTDLNDALIKAYHLMGKQNSNVKYYHKYFDGKCAQRIVDWLLK